MILIAAKAFTPTVISSDPDMTYTAWNNYITGSGTMASNLFILYLNSLSTSPIFSYDQLSFFFPEGSKIFGSCSTNTSSTFLLFQPIFS